MCGIAGIFAYHSAAPPVRVEEVLTIREAMQARGPDGAGLWVSQDERVALAHRRLSIIDLSEAGAQPMGTFDQSVWVVFNGEIYNYRELRENLETRGYRFRSHSDTEVLLHLYQEYGDGMMGRLRGMYAFAIWDNIRKSLLLSRDPFGIKPLYYADDGKTLRFASQVKALLAGDAVDTRPQPAGHAGFFLWGYVPEPYTLFRGIRALPAGSTRRQDLQGNHRVRSFGAIPAELEQAYETGKQAGLGREAVHAKLGAALADSINHHLVADVPVGIFLSSGLDSSTITALACQAQTQGRGQLHSLTLGFQELRGGGSDETSYAAEIAARYGTKHQTRWITREDFQRDYHHILEVMDQPATDGKLMKESPAGNEVSAASVSELKGIDNIERSLHRACSAEIGKLENTLGFLATTGSVCPFIGLFGTVWGIMDTFRGIGTRGSATLAVVAPGISEALVATAAGLAAAIPAVVFYNYFQNNIKALATEMDSFASEMLNILERHYTKR